MLEDGQGLWLTASELPGSLMSQIAKGTPLAAAERS